SLDKSRRDEARAADELRAEGNRLRAALYLSGVNGTKALEVARTEGWREKALNNLSTIAKLDTPRDLAALRLLASDCLTGVDVVHERALRPDLVKMVSYSPDGQTLYVACEDRTILAYDARTGEPRPPLQNLHGEVGEGELVGLWCHPQGHYL